MKNPTLLNKTISILVKAFQDDTLIHGNCSACAVGNLVLANGNFTTKISEETPNKPWAGKWRFLFMTDFVSKKQQIYIENEMDNVVQKVISSTGYIWQDLAKIEYAFETAHRGKSADEYIFNGLMAVVDTLMLIHEATPEETESAKLQFVKP